MPIPKWLAFRLLVKKTQQRRRLSSLQFYDAPQKVESASFSIKQKPATTGIVAGLEKLLNK